MVAYDRAITVFSPDGRLFQVEYALEAVKKGTIAIGIMGKNCSVIVAERKAVPKLQETRTIRKVVMIDDHICLAFAGLNADARVLINKARIGCQSYRLDNEDAPSCDYVASSIAKTKQEYTHRGGTRPFGISCLLIGLSKDQTPVLYQTDPSGTYFAFRASAIGRSSKIVLEYLEKNIKDDMTEEQTLALSIKAILEVVEPGSKNLEVVLCNETGDINFLSETEIEKLLQEATNG